MSTSKLDLYNNKKEINSTDTENNDCNIHTDDVNISSQTILPVIKPITPISIDLSAISQPIPLTSKNKITPIPVVISLVYILVIFGVLFFYQNNNESLRDNLYESEVELNFDNSTDNITSSITKLDEPLMPYSPTYIPTIKSLNKIPAAGDGEPIFFNIGINSINADDIEYTFEDNEISINSANLDDIKEVISKVEKSGDVVSTFILNLQTGEGISYNIDDENIYSASTVKALIALYETKNVLDAESPKYNKKTIMSLIKPMILQSDNDTFSSLRENYSGKDYYEWLESFGLDKTIHGSNKTRDFAWYSARQAGYYWMYINKYLEEENEHSEWFGTLLANTNKSFIKDAVIDIYGNEDIKVFNKAGWYNDPETKYCSTSDNGIVITPNGKYLISVMTTIPWSSSAEDKVSNIAKTLLLNMKTK